ncbi:MAG: winged helix-turn-helix transcriptional regulator [Candidatus Hydrogenedentes bacterium]|nr:winged helix-turn-helix transcriptional regulator [Candidatus Hydrogenedentota bacterium]
MSEALNPDLFKALCEPMRVGLLAQLTRLPQPATVSQIAACCPIDLSVVSRHLAVLRDCGILTAEKRGKEVFYSVRYNELAATLRGMAEAIEQCCPPGTETGRYKGDDDEQSCNA